MYRGVELKPVVSSMVRALSKVELWDSTVCVHLELILDSFSLSRAAEPSQHVSFLWVCDSLASPLAQVERVAPAVSWS